MESTATLPSFLRSADTPVRPVWFPRFRSLGMACALGLALIAPPAVTSADLFVQVNPPGWTNMPPTPFLTAWGDYDGDGFLDALVPRFEVENAVSGRSYTNLLYHNNGDGSFTLKAFGEVGPIASDNDQSFGGLWGDVNNDGRLDVLVANLSYPDSSRFVVSRLYLNQGNGAFSSAQAGALTQPYAVRAVANWCDYDNDGWLDAFIPSSRGTSDDSKQHLLHGRGDGAFDPVTEGSMASDLPGSGDTLWSDFDNDGDVDLLVPRYNQFNLVYRNDGHGRFTRLTNSLLESPQSRFLAPSVGDLDNDGDLDLIANAAVTESLAVFLNDGRGDFARAFTLPEMAMPLLSDYDNDGDLDLLESDDAFGSNISRMHLYRNDGTGRFESVDDALTRATWSGGPWVDDNNDGFMDLHAFRVSGNRVINVVFRNQGNGNHWLKFRLVGTTSNRSAIGAKIRVKATLGGKSVWQMREIISYYIIEDGLRAHFGLRDATKAEEVSIEWPSGNVQILTDVAADQILTVTEPMYFQPVQPVATINGSILITNTVVASARQWYFEGAPLQGETGQVLALTHIQPSQSGRYSLVAQTASGPQTNHVHLRVLTQFTKILEGDLVTEEFGFDVLTWFDLDRDGWLDVFAPHDYDSRLVPTDSLFRNQGDGTFERLPDGPLTRRAGSSHGAAVADYDADGDIDVLVFRGPSPAVSTWGIELLRNDGHQGFTQTDALASIPATAEASDGGWADYDRDGDLDLFVALGSSQLQSDLFFRNEGSGTFTQLSEADVGSLVSDKALAGGATWQDYNADGWPDLLVYYQTGAATTRYSRLYRNEGNGRLTTVPSGSLEAMRLGVGGIWGDYDNDGFPDFLVLRFEAGTGGLHRNVHGTTFTNVVVAGDLKNSILGFDCWGSWGDYDNDGYLDLFVSGYSAPGKLFRNRGDGTFQSVPAGNFLTDGTHRGGPAWVDYDNNGFLDLMMPCGDGVIPPDYSPQRCHLYRNNGNGNHWLKARLVGTVSNRDGIGAKVRVTATLGGRPVIQMREISGNSSIHGVPLLAHFGLGNATNATTVRIEWPSGIVQELTQIAADQFLTLTEPARVELAVSRVSEGIRLEWHGETNMPYTLKISGNLKDWGTARIVTTDALGIATTTTALDSIAQFYRVVNR